MIELTPDNVLDYLCQTGRLGPGSARVTPLGWGVSNAVMPGVIETRHHDVFSTPARMESYRQQTPLARNGHADEVARAVLFLASDASSFLTGALIDINGGRFLR